MVSEEDARTRAEALVRAYCGWSVAPQKREVLRVTDQGGGALLLPSLHVTDLHSLTIDGEPVDSSNLRWSTNGVVHLHRGVTASWAWGGRWNVNGVSTIEADVTHGYQVWPAELLGVVEALASRSQVTPSQYVQVGQVRVATGSDGQPLGGALSLNDRDLLNLYRLPPRP